MAGMSNYNKHMPTGTPTDELLTKNALARRLKLCERKVELMVKAGEIPAIKIGRSVRYNWQRVLEALEENQPHN